jgi:hypothetical protein
VALGHGFLHAVQLALVLEVFDADQLLAVQRRHKGQAGVEAAIANLSVPCASACNSPTTTVQAPQSPLAQPSLVPDFAHARAGS